MVSRIQPREFVFAGREKELEIMDGLLADCREGHLIHVCGIPGIGKSHILEFWNRNIGTAVLIDCLHRDTFLTRIKAISAGLQRVGLNLPRFQFLWRLRLKLLDGVEPVSSDSLGWLVKPLKLVPVVGDFVKVAEGISALGGKIREYFDSHRSDIADYFRGELGSEYGTEILRIFWKEPALAQQVLLKALSEDIKQVKSSQIHPLVIMLDRFEKVDSSHLKWRLNETMLAESDLWLLFLSSTPGCIGASASRETLHNGVKDQLRYTEIELDSLNTAASLELCRQMGIEDTEICKRIVDISHGYPDIIVIISELLLTLGTLRPEDLNDLRSPSMKEVRRRAWKTLFNSTETSGILGFASLLPLFNKPCLEVASQSQVDELSFASFTDLSVVRRSDWYHDGQSESEWWELHELARELAAGVLSGRIQALAQQASRNLMKAYLEGGPPIYAGLSFSSAAQYSEQQAITQIESLLNRLGLENKHEEILSIIEPVRLQTSYGHAWIQAQLGSAHFDLGFIGSAEFAYQESEAAFRELFEKSPRSYGHKLASVLTNLGMLLAKTSRSTEAIDLLKEAVVLFQSYGTLPESSNENLLSAMHNLGEAFRQIGEFTQAEEILKDALSLAGKTHSKHTDLAKTASLLNALGTVYWQTSRDESSEDAYKASLRLLDQIQRPYSNETSILLSTVLNNSGVLFGDSARFDEAKTAFEKSLNLRRILVQRVPHFYERDVASTLVNLGELYRLTSDFKNAEKALLESIEIRRRLSSASAELYEPSLANSLSNLAMVYASDNRHELAESNLREALDILQLYAATAPEVHSSDLARAHLNIGILKWQKSSLDDAESNLNRAISLYETPMENNYHHHRANKSKALFYLALVFLSTNRLPKALQAMKDARTLNPHLHEHQKSDPIMDIETQTWALSLLDKLLTSDGSKGLPDSIMADINNLLQKLKDSPMAKLPQFRQIMLQTLHNSFDISPQEAEELLDDLLGSNN